MRVAAGGQRSSLGSERPANASGFVGYLSKILYMKSFALCLLLSAPCAEAPAEALMDSGSDAPGDSGRPESDADSSGATEYGRGEYAIILSEPPGRYCWHLAEHRRVCPGDSFVRRSVSHQCTDDLLECRETEPENTESDGYCFESTTWRTVGGEALHGSCDAHANYWGDTAVNCLYHRHCASDFDDAAVCVDYRCQCSDRDCEDRLDAGMTDASSVVDASVVDAGTGTDAGTTADAAEPLPPGP